MNMEELNNIELDVYIDKYLDEVLSEAETDEFETKCLEHKLFYQRVRAREQLREKVAKVIKEDGEEIFANYVQKKRHKATKMLFESLINKILQFWKNVRPIWKYSLVPVGAMVVFLLFVLLGTDIHFKKYPPYESFIIDNQHRTSPYKFEIISPSLNEKIDRFIQFNWQTETGKKFKVYIVNNKGNEVASFGTFEKNYIFKETLTPGLYYWKFLSDDEWVYTGKFIVKKK